MMTPIILSKYQKLQYGVRTDLSLLSISEPTGPTLQLHMTLTSIVINEKKVTIPPKYSQIREAIATRSKKFLIK